MKLVVSLLVFGYLNTIMIYLCMLSGKRCKSKEMLIKEDDSQMKYLLNNQKRKRK